MLLKRVLPYAGCTVLFWSVFGGVHGALACAQPTAIYPDLSLIPIHSNAGLPLDYIPADMVDLGTQIEANGGVCLKQDAGEGLIRMFEAAEKDGVRLAVTSAYRHVYGQADMYRYWLKTDRQEIEYTVEKPGFSEHQLGMAVDLTDSSVGFRSADPNFYISRGGRWMRKNAHKYGFVMSHSDSDGNGSNAGYEPWHWRYVGLDLTEQIYSWRGADISKLGEGEEWPALVSTEKLKPVFLGADGFISAYINGDQKTVLLAKNENQPLPIASISKLATVIAIQEYYKEDAEVVIGGDNLSGKGSAYRYRTGDTFWATDLLYSVLVESDNDAVIAFAEALNSERTLVNMMNSIADQLGMEKTIFYTATGLDFWSEGPKYNLSTPSDLVLLVREILSEYPKIMDITRTPVFILYDASGEMHHVILNTNQLLSDASLGMEVIGGKTGTTPVARKNLVLVTKPPLGEGVVVSVVLGSDDQFADMRALITGVREDYLWN
ncbi:MAG: D-alanyl-D-alanine carboxypeptidase family protein [Candidatus Colwellbacteria bacterium]|nr:D-alanyl-D-alanine carboxypeptidase family protein [Candidatus Colwellbacteria bacterium]